MTITTVRPERHVDQVSNVHDPRVTLAQHQQEAAAEHHPCGVTGCPNVGREYVEFNRTDGATVCGQHRHDWVTATINGTVAQFRATLS